ncbi:hypothetical protein [Megasphaera sp.]|uniref:hypothetical protein n=1 Tax=Megasphaera sp. TaxID=2023260 RepID=UPI0025DB50A3|nr:hypothetical protein [uncultured Megasphaera sp.]
MFQILVGIAEVISSAVSLVASIVKTVGIELVQFARMLTELAKGLGLMEPESDVIELGDKGIQAEEMGITPDKFEEYDDYLRAVKDFEVDKDKSVSISEDDKLKKGAELVTAVLISKYGDLAATFLWLCAKMPSYFEPRMPYLTTTPKDSDSPAFVGITRYLEGKETDFDKNLEAEKMLTEIDKTVEPDITDSKIEEQRRALEAIIAMGQKEVE